jgi:2-C-methyl-D-erythritol 4-phosphate cytidylyltransferase
MGGAVPKQYLELGGVPVLLRAIRPFTSHPDVCSTVVVLPPGDAPAPPAWLARLVGGALRIAAGGTARVDSVRAGLAVLPAECAIVLVQDGARPLTRPTTVSAVIAAAREGFGAVAAVPLGDTLKEVRQEGSPLRVLRTVPREGLWRAQTPQGFPRPLLERALARAARDGYTGTDDAELVERAGGEITIVPDSPDNLKITTPDDLEVARRLLDAGA